MSASERGVYRDLIDLAYMSDNKIRYSIDRLARYTNSDEETVEKVLKLKGEKRGDYWTIPSCEKRIKIAKRNHENGQRGGRPKTQHKPNTNPEENPNETQTKRQIEREIEIENKIEKEESDSRARTRERDESFEQDSDETSHKIPVNSMVFLYQIDHLENELIRSISWKESVGMKHSISLDEVDRWIKEFSLHLKASGEERKSLKDAKKHFASWVRIRIEDEAKKGPVQSSQSPGDNSWRSNPNTRPSIPGDWRWSDLAGRWLNRENLNRTDQARWGVS